MAGKGKTMYEITGKVKTVGESAVFGIVKKHCQKSSREEST